MTIKKDFAIVTLSSNLFLILTITVGNWAKIRRNLLRYKQGNSESETEKFDSF